MEEAAEGILLAAERHDDNQPRRKPDASRAIALFGFKAVIIIVGAILQREAEDDGHA